MRKSFDELTIVDDYMFCTVMQDEELCKELLSMILKNKVGKIVRLFKQQPIETQIASKGVRLDIMIEDDRQRMYIPVHSLTSSFEQSSKHRNAGTTAIRGGFESAFLKIGGADSRRKQKTPAGVLFARRGLFFVK